MPIFECPEEKCSVHEVNFCQTLPALLTADDSDLSSTELKNEYENMIDDYRKVVPGFGRHLRDLEEFDFEGTCW